MCVGVSSYRPTRDEAVAEANDAALEELVSAIGLKISDPFFRDTVISSYSDVRSKALSALQATELDRGERRPPPPPATWSPRRASAWSRSSTSRAAPRCRPSAPTGTGKQYAAAKGGTEVLVFVRYDVSLDAIKALVEKYSAATPIIGSTAMTAFPALAWQYPDFTGGVILTKVGRALADAGVASHDVIMSIGDQRVGDTTSFARRLEEWKQGSGDLALTVKSGGAPARVVQVRRQRVK